MGWTKGKPRLSEEEQAERAARSERSTYDMAVPYKHGDGKAYGCGETVLIVRLLDLDADTKKATAMTEHKATCWAKSDDKPKRAKGEAVVAALVDAEADKADKALRTRIEKGGV